MRCDAQLKILGNCKNKNLEFEKTRHFIKVESCGYWLFDPDSYNDAENITALRKMHERDLKKIAHVYLDQNRRIQSLETRMHSLESRQRK